MLFDSEPERADEIGRGSADLEVEPPEISQSHDGSGGCAENAQIGCFGGAGIAKSIGDGDGRFASALFIGTAEDDAGDTAERRGFGFVAFGEFVSGEAEIVVSGGKLHSGVIGSGGLNEDSPASFPASGATGDLCDELERAFRGAQIGLSEHGVGVDDTDECDIGEIKSFGDHLGTQQHINFTATEAVEGFIVAAWLLH